MALSTKDLLYHGASIPFTDMFHCGKMGLKVKPFTMLKSRDEILPRPWSTGTCLVLSKVRCVYCYGRGVTRTDVGEAIPCRCVFRHVFKICFNRYQYLRDEKKPSYVHFRNVVGKNDSPYSFYSMPREEFVADFEIICRRSLTGEQLRIIKLHFFQSKTWRECCPILRINRGHFFHQVYRIEERLGRAFAEIVPYPLYPPDEYFVGNRVAAFDLHRDLTTKLQEREKTYGRRLDSYFRKPADGGSILTPRTMPTGGGLPERLRATDAKVVSGAGLP